MKKIMFYFIIMFAIGLNMNIVTAEPVENDFGIVNAWYNGQEATVRDVQLKIGETAEIKVEVTSKINGHIFVKLTTPLKTESYEIISGPSVFNKRIDNLNIESNWTKIYIWKIKPTGEWTNGNAPINLYVQFNRNYDDVKSVEFTIANPIILDEKYSGSSPSHTTTNFSSTDQSQTNSSPSFGIIATLLSTALVVMWRQRKIT
jgi:sarcinarray family protein